MSSSIRAVWITLGVTTILALLLPSARVPADGLGIRRFQTPPVSASVRFSQTFEMTADGLEAIEFRPARTGPAPSGAVTLSILEVTSAREREIGRREVAAVDLVAGRWFRFSFPPVERSRGRAYRLDVSSSETTPVEGVALWATKGDRYDRGALFINGTTRWADMAFRAVAPSPPIWRALLFRPARGAVVVAALALTWLALGAVLRALGAPGPVMRER